VEREIHDLNFLRRQFAQEKKLSTEPVFLLIGPLQPTRTDHAPACLHYLGFHSVPALQGFQPTDLAGNDVGSLIQAGEPCSENAREIALVRHGQAMTDFVVLVEEALDLPIHGGSFRYEGDTISR